MSNERKVSLTKKNENRPVQGAARDETVTAKVERRPLSGFRDILSVEGKDPNYVYRFVKDVDSMVENKEGGINLKPGQRIMRFQAAGWTFVDSESVTVGSNHIWKTENVGSIVRVPAGNNEYLYLMRISREWYEEDQRAKERSLIDIENQYSGEPQGEGMYGSVSIGHD